MVLAALFECLTFFMQERLKALTDIVWPEIKHLVTCRINQAREKGSVQLIFIFM